TDSFNHFTDVNIGRNTSPDQGSLEAKRARIILEGNVFDPNLRYGLVFDGNTRGIPGFDPRFNAFANPIGTIEGGPTIATTDHAVRFFSGFVAYDFRPCDSQPGCACECPPGTYRYTPTLTAIIGKIKPATSFEEWACGSGNQQFVEY